VRDEVERPRADTPAARRELGDQDSLLTMIGDGPLREEVEAERQRLGLTIG
jgi:hypothetical protein